MADHEARPRLPKGCPGAQVHAVKVYHVTPELTWAPRAVPEVKV